MLKFSLYRGLSVNVTSYDLLKCFALITMIADHIGFYFYPENDLLRMIGRLCVPIWFFLIGYAKSRDLSLSIWAGLLVLLWFNFFTSMPIFPLNILASIIFVRFLIDHFAWRMMMSKYDFLMANLTMVLLIYPTIMFFEYGTLSLGLAMFGYLVRNKSKLNIKTRTVILYGVFIYLIYLLFTVSFQALFSLGNIVEQWKIYFLIISLLFIFIVLYRFGADEYERFSAKFSFTLSPMLKFMGRHTLLIYVVHLCLFKVMFLYFNDIEPFQLNWIYH